MSKQSIELLIILYQQQADENVSEVELQHISTFFPEILAEILQRIEQDQE
ncbi:hypothetical protein INP77_05440 [Methylophilus sp. 13]|nr:hypothetical protein [Methylophilus sp. 13]MBF5038933.1 hypothetical protein [Methylophilus sp. 13]